MFPDKQSGLENMLREVGVTLKDASGRMYKEYGIIFWTCPAQAHWQHGRVERVARSIRESLRRTDFTGQRLHIMGWQTICKSIENTLNDVPIGYTSKHTKNNAEILEVLSPNVLKFGRLNARSPQAPLLMPDVDLRDYTLKVQQLWEAWWKLWQEYYVEQLFEQQKWFTEGEEVQIGDLVMFKKKSSEFNSHFSLGKIDEVCESHDDRVRNVWIRYKNATENNSRRVQRDVKTIYKVLGVKDTSLHASLEQAWKIVQEIKFGVTPQSIDVQTEMKEDVPTDKKEDVPTDRKENVPNDKKKDVQTETILEDGN